VGKLCTLSRLLRATCVLCIQNNAAAWPPALCMCICTCSNHAVNTGSTVVTDSFLCAPRVAAVCLQLLQGAVAVAEGVAEGGDGDDTVNVIMKGVAMEGIGS
jgi:hypothetical protein